MKTTRSQQLKDLAARRRQYSRDAERCERLADRASAPGGEGLGVAATWRPGSDLVEAGRAGER